MFTNDARDYVLRTLTATIAALAVALMSPSPAETIWVKYESNLTTLPLPPSHPDQFGWLTSMPSPYTQEPFGTLVADPLAGGLSQAWQITEPAAGDVLLNYSFAWPSMQDLPPPMLQNGWTLNTTARHDSNLNGNRSQGLLAFYDNRRYEVTVDFDATGGLQAFIETAPGTALTFPLKPAAEASRFYDYELRFDPASGLVSFVFDHQEIHSWQGTSLVHEPRFVFGTVKAGGAGRMNYTQATLAILDPPPTPTEQGDYNGDRRVDLRDYNLWRDTLGSASNLLADGNGNRRIDRGDYTVWKSNLGRSVDGGPAALTIQPTPEPGSLILVLVCLVVGIRRWRG